MTEPRLVKMNSRDPDLASLREVAKAGREGKLICFPTETGYGMGAPMSVPGLGEKLLRLKRESNPELLNFYIGEWEMVDFLRIKKTPVFRYLSRVFWPGPVTLMTLTEQGDSIAVRYPRSLLVTALINSTGQPFLGVSASRPGESTSRSADQVLGHFKNDLDFIVDSGDCEYSEDATVVDLRDENNVRLVHRGALAAEAEAVLEKVRSGKFPRRKVLIVCTGNSCRSPMAEGWLRDELERRGMSDEIEIASCGVGTRDGMPATPEAVFVMKNREVDISAHRSRQCTREDILSSDVILAMSQQHSLFITSMMPVAKDKIRVLNVMDPIGMSLPVYEDVMNVIEKKMQSLWFDIVG